MCNRTIILTESQLNRLFEAATEAFSIDKLEALDGEQRYLAAVKLLGEPYAEGSSRAVFDIDDETVLKMAYSESGSRDDDVVGREQNKAEYEVVKAAGNNPIVPIIKYISEDGSMMICERVMPADEVDFERYLGIPFEYCYLQNTSAYEDDESTHTPVGYDKYFGNTLKKPEQGKEKYDFKDIAYYIEQVYLDSDTDDDEGIDEADRDNIEAFIDSNWWLSRLRNLVAKTQFSDFSSIGNFGIVKRDNKHMLVILDTGMSQSVGEKYYA